MTKELVRYCEHVVALRPLQICNTWARWRWPCGDDSYMYFCDEHGIAHLNEVEAV